MQLKRHRLSKETFDTVFDILQNRCSSCNNKKDKKPVALPAAGKSPVQLAFQKISIYNVLIEVRVRKSDKTDPDRNIFSIRGGSLQTTEFEFEHCNPFLYLFLEKRERDHRCVTKYLARKSKKGLV